ncbi:shikimate dehydrogenase [Brevibacillus dissolubilis]|uniref:shikimate dehydrogenase n=1 Tax=Brevibacillus dissolubilis TaxID=1844116 RepID=UPI001117285D|nr:shikimate dehydrogenase [Brevibacillus dissolubilis]
MITSKTKLVGLFGHPVGHSQSPLMHNAAFEHKRLAFAYAAFDILPEDLGEAVAGIRALGLRGVNVTIPHKETIMRHLDEIDPLAARIGAVNTVVNDGGHLIGYNTDGTGYVRSFVEETGVLLSNQVVTLIGAGGAARAVACTLADKGVREIRIVNRSRERAQKLAAHISPWVKTSVYAPDDGNAVMTDTTLLINTTSIGMYPNVDEMPVPLDWLHSDLIVSDLIYNPLETKLLTTARELGAMVHSGIGMFINQGALAFELWTGEEAPTDIMRETVLKQLQQGGQ